MEKKPLLNRQIIIVLWLIGAAISLIETSVQYKIGGFSNWRLYFFASICFICILMYFKNRKQRSGETG